jgi:L-ascorbate metabolism protein UlaG (beta-lactamase superfamily)
MVITHQGGNYFKIQSGDYAVLIDPENQRSFKGAQVVINTVKPTFAEPQEGEGAPVWIEHQGEYEIGGVRIHVYSCGWNEKAKCESTAYYIFFDDISIAVLGHLYTELDPKTVGMLTDADILIVPAGGSPFLEITKVAKLIRQLEPGIVIPSLTEKPLALFKELNREAKPEEKLTIKKKEIESKAIRVVWLQS